MSDKQQQERAREDWEQLIEYCKQGISKGYAMVHESVLLYAANQIEALEGRVRELEKQAKNDRMIMDHQGAQMQRLATELEQQNRKAQRWVKTSERLPPGFLVPVLANITVVHDLGGNTWQEVVYYDGERWRGYAGGTDFEQGQQVTHWQPINPPASAGD